MRDFRKKKTLKKTYTERPYEDTTKYSLFDVLISERKVASHHQQHKSRDIVFSRTAKDITQIEKTMFGSPIVLRENLEDLEAPAKKKDEFSTFYFHKKTFEYTKNSCNIFTPDNKIRHFCLRVSSSNKAKYLIMILVLIHAILLGFYDFLDRQNPNSLNSLINVLEPIFLAIYAIECVIKIIAQGFYAEPNTYLRNIYNFFDFVVVVTAVFSYEPMLQHLGVIRLFRVLMFLEKLKFLESLNLLMQSLQKSIIHLLIIFVFWFFTLMVFSIVSVNWWKDLVINDQELNIGNYTKFDNIRDAFLTNTEVYLRDNWQQKYYVMKENNNGVLSACYLIFLLIICSYFISNMFLGAVLSNFAKIIKASINNHHALFSDLKISSGSEGRKNKENLILNILLRINEIVCHNPKPTVNIRTMYFLQRVIFNLIYNSLFQFVLNLVVIMNLVVLSLLSYPDEYCFTILEKINYACSIFFIIEIFLKLFAVGADKFKDDIFNIYEFIVTFVIIIELKTRNTNLSILSSLKSLRIFRIFFYTRKWDYFQILLEALGNCLLPTLSFALIYTIYIYVFSIIGMNLFAGKTIKYDQSRSNFDSLIWAFFTVYQIISLENWQIIYHTYLLTVESSWIVHIYFMTLIFFGNFVLKNVFLAGVLGIFEMTRNSMKIQKIKALTIIKGLKLTQLFSKKHRVSTHSPQFSAEPFKRSQTLKAEVREPKNAPSQEVELDGVHKENCRVNFKKKKSSYINHSNELDKTPSSPRTKKVPSVFSGGRPIPTNPNKTTLITDENLFTESNFDFEEKPIDSKISKKKSKTQVFPLDLKHPQPPTQRRQKPTKPTLINIMQSGQSALSYSGNMTIIRKNIRRPSLSLTGFNCWDCLSNSSCIFFHANSKMRQNIGKLINSRFWKYLILCLIFGNSLYLMFDNPLNDPTSKKARILSIFNYIFTILFFIEMSLKVIHVGFFFNNYKKVKPYIRNVWNQFDFVILLFNIIAIAFPDYPALKNFRQIRVIRILNVIKTSESMKIIINAIYKTIPSLLNLVIIVFFVLLIISINTMNKWKGTFFSCQLPANLLNPTPIFSRNNCLSAGGLWVNQNLNFDNIGNSCLAFFFIIVGSDWLDILDSTLDSVGIDEEPIYNRNPGNIILFYFFILFGNILLFNLFIGVVIDNFNQQKEKVSGCVNMNPEQREWVDLQRFILRKKLKFLISRPENHIQGFCYDIVNAKWFHICVFLLTTLYFSLTLSVSHGMSKMYENLIEVYVGIILSLFHVEMVLKFMALGMFFFKDPWNNYDLATILFTDICCVSLTSKYSFLKCSLGLLFRAFKIGKILKQFKMFTTLQILIDTYFFIIPSLINIGILIYLVIFIYAIFGINLFSSIEINNSLVTDFSDFPNALLTLVQCATGQSFGFYMFEYAISKPDCEPNQTQTDISLNGIKGCGTYWSYPYFISFILLVPLMTINLFMAIVIEGYFISENEHESVINPKHIDEMLTKWSDYDPKGTGFISYENLAFLLHDLYPPIGLKDKNLNYDLDLVLFKKNKGVICNHKKNVFLTKKQLWETVNLFNIIVYNEKEIHFKNFYQKLSKIVLQKKHNVDKFQINSEYVKTSLNEQWTNKFKALKKMEIEAKSRNFKLAEVHATLIILSIRKKYKQQKNKDVELQKIKTRVDNETMKQEMKRNDIISSQKLYKLSAVKKFSHIPDSPIKQQAISPQIRPSFHTRTSMLFGETHNSIVHKVQARRECKLHSISIDSKDNNNDLNRLGSIREQEDGNDERLFWFSYDEDLKVFPNGVKLEKMKFMINDDKNEEVFSFRKPTFRSNRKIEEKKEYNSEESEEKTNTVNSLNNC